MASHLSVAGPQQGGNAPSRSFRVDTRPQLWTAAIFSGASIAVAIAGFADRMNHLASATLAAVLLFAALWAATSAVGSAAVRYTLSATRIEVERGLLSKRVESIDLWRVRDVVLDQGLLQRLRGTGRVTLHSSDRVEPVLVIGPIAEARPLFDELREAVAGARKAAQVVPVDG